MSFFDSYTDLGGGGSYITAAEKQFLIENGVAFEITGLTFDPENQYGPRWVAFIKAPNQEGEVEERKVGFPHGTGAGSRDAMLDAMSKYLQSDEAQPVKVKLSKPGRAILIEKAE